MDPVAFQAWVKQNPLLAVSAAIVFGAVVFLFTRNIVARFLVHLAGRTATKIDDILVKHLQPFRIAWIAPFLVAYALAFLLPDYQAAIEHVAQFAILWISVITLIALMNAVNEIYESRPGFSGVSIQSYLDIAKILLVVVAIILSITLFTGESPLVLLTGLGALTAVLLLIFQNTILSLVASVQIVSHDLLKEGDFVEVPSYEAEGDVVNISLHTIKIQNSDKTFTVIPTYKIVDVAYKNWRGMRESGARRLQRSLYVDMNSVKFCDDRLLMELSKIDLISAYIEERMDSIQAYRVAHADHFDSPLDGPQITNIEVFRHYVVTLLRNRDDIYQEGVPFIVRCLAPTPKGLPVELYIFTKTTEWAKFEKIQAEIFDHLLAAAGHFGLQVFQEPTGMDFSNFAGEIARMGQASGPAAR